MSKIRNMGITDKWGFWRTCHSHGTYIIRNVCSVAIAAQNLKDIRNSSPLTCSHYQIIILLEISRNENKILSFCLFLACLCPFKCWYCYHECQLQMNENCLSAHYQNERFLNVLECAFPYINIVGA